MRHICKMEKLGIRVAIKYFCKKECIQRKFMKTSWKPFVKESHFYRTVNKWAAELKRGEEVLRLMDGLAALKMPPLMNMSRSCTP